MKTPPAFQFYPQDFLVGCADMTPDEVGGYIRLLCYQWTKGGIPNDMRKIRQLTGLFDEAALKCVLVKFCVYDDGLLRNERLEQTRTDQRAYSEKQSKIARDGWEKRRQINGMGSHSQPDANAKPTHVPEVSQNDGLHLQSSSTTTTTTASTTSNKVSVAENLAKRKKIFASTLEPFLETYGRDLLNEFYAYWTEDNKSGTQFRKEMEKAWSIDRRLKTWATKDKTFNNGNTKNKPATAADSLAEAKRSMAEHIDTAFKDQTGGEPNVSDSNFSGGSNSNVNAWGTGSVEPD